MKKLIEKFWMTEKEILEYAKRRDDLWEYEDEYLLDFIRWNQHWDLDDILDEFSHYWIEYEEDDRVGNWQELHLWQIVVETNWELGYHEIESEDDEITEDLYRAVLKATKFESKILSITRIN